MSSSPIFNILIESRERKNSKTNNNLNSSSATIKIPLSQPPPHSLPIPSYQHSSNNNYFIHPNSDPFAEHANSLYSSLSPPLVDQSSDQVYSKSSQLYYRTNDLNNSKSKDKIIQYIANVNKKISAFLPVEEVAKNDQIVSNNEMVRQIYSDIYSNEGQIDILIRLISFHPNFLREFVKLYNHLMYSQGALPYESRHYIAIMAAAQHKCYYLVNQQENEFTQQNGQKSWLQGIEFIPQKLKDLFELNKLLCHKPWLINQFHIKKLLRSQNSWSITELIMATTILTHFHAFSGFVFGCGVNENFMQELAIEKQRQEDETRRLAQEAANAATAKFVDRFEAQQSDESDCESNYCDEEDEGYEIIYNFEYNIGPPRFNRASRNNYRSNDIRERGRSDSTGTANRTLSNSSASSCEIGIDTLLKEMQMLQSDRSYSSCEKSNSNLCLNRSSVSSSSSSFTCDSAFNSSLSIRKQKQGSGCNTITNSPISSSVSNGQITTYLLDLSNCKKSTNFHNNKPNNSFNNNHNYQANNLNNENEDSYYCDDESDQELGLNEQSDCAYMQIEQNDSNINSIKSSTFKFSNCNSTGKKKHHQTQNKLLQQQPVNTKKFIPDLTSHLIAQTNKEMLKYTNDLESCYLNFKSSDEQYKLEWNNTWENQGYRTANSFYSEICELLDSTFRIAGNMTYHTLGSYKHVDTSLFRRAVWLYIHSLFGVRYDDYDYNQIKQLLSAPLRKYIKILCSCPERITKKDYDSIMKEFTHSEKVHINIVIMEARIQASMLYFLRAINAYFTSNSL